MTNGKKDPSGTEANASPRKLKTLATCKPSEFLSQTYRVKKKAEQWLTETDILAIRRNMPDLLELPEVDEDATPEELAARRKARAEAEKDNQERLARQSRENMSRIFDAIAGEHPTETMELLALCCFVEPERIDDYEIADYLDAFAEMLGHSATIRFFVSWVRLTRILSPNVLNR